MWHVWGRIQMHAGFSLGNQKTRDHMEDLVVDVRIIFKCILKKWMEWSGMDLIHPL
jgi:hypothetical protein